MQKKYVVRLSDVGAGDVEAACHQDATVSAQKVLRARFFSRRTRMAPVGPTLEIAKAFDCRSRRPWRKSVNGS